ncbi:MAG: amino acid deaminase, partial [Alphaproteobacteria bacterium]|nr:amino acid deaminase [Alphaproteobacteria bacterium]
PLRLGDIGKRGWNVLAEDVGFPACVIRESALARNAEFMRAFLGATGARIAPHGKTTMSPELFRRQLDEGAWAITVATPQQIAVARHFGAARIVLANQLVDRHGLAFVLEEIARDPGFDFYCLVDSLALVERLAKAARARNPGRPLQVLLEGGMRGGRTGARDVATGLAIARAVKAAAPHLALRGVEGFEGLVSGEGAPAKVQAFLDFLADLATKVEAEGLFAEGPVILSAGGSAFYDLAARTFGRVVLKRPPFVLTRSGCYITHDAGNYRLAFASLGERAPDLAALGKPEDAVELWTQVQSRPEPGLALVVLGKRDSAWGPEAPVPRLHYRPGATPRRPTPLPEGHRVGAMNDQHTYLEIPETSPLAVGDLVGFGISHPCLTFDRWQVILTVDDDYTVTGAIKTYF